MVMSNFFSRRRILEGALTFLLSSIISDFVFFGWTGDKET